MDERHATPCCWFEDDDEVLTQCAEEFDCSTCKVPEQWARLGPLNSHAWRVYSAASTRLTGDGQAFGAVIVQMMGPLDADEFQDAWQRLSLLHDILSPKRDAKGS